MKKFSLKFLLLFLLFISCFFFYQFLLFSKIINANGDLGRLGQIDFGSEYETLFKKYRLSKQFVYDVTFDEIKEKDGIFTIGDSFSEQDSLGYQNYLGKELNQSIYNVVCPESSLNTSLDVFFFLMNNNFFDKKDTIIFESVERGWIKQFLAMDTTLSSYHKRKVSSPITKHSLSLETKFSYFLSWIRLKVNFKNPVKHAYLRKELFTHPKYSKDLFFYKDDLNFTGLNQGHRRKASEQLKQLYDFSRKKGIKIFIMIAVNKYDLYSKFIDPKPVLVDSTLSLIYSNDSLLNTKELLLPYLDYNCKDLYKVNDTHWSPKAAQIVAKELKRMLIKE